MIIKYIKVICLISILLSVVKVSGQVVSDFEGLTLTTSSYWNGSDLSGANNSGVYNSQFISGAANYSNVYNSNWSYWSGGFAYSNMTDTITSGAVNLYSARTGAGVNSSSNYLIAQQNSIINLTGAAQNSVVSGVYITNGTYAANSMRDGDSFGKQFGGLTGNDPDWFKLTVRGYAAGNQTNDSVVFYLSDYRFANNTQDYIVTTWEWVDLTPLGVIDSIIFVLTSSDVGGFGMNTPAFFALDNFNFTSISTGEMTNNESPVSFYPNPSADKIYFNLKTQLSYTYKIINISGELIISGNLSDVLDVQNLKSGIYFIQIESVEGVMVQKFVKN